MKTNKRIIINQPYFLGDIIFVMGLVQKLIEDGNNVIYPVRDEYINLQKNFPTVKLIKLSDFPQYESYNKIQPIFEDDSNVAISLRHSYSRKGDNQHMKNKYECIGFPMSMWRNINITRDYETENKLFNELGLKDGDEYNLINEFHRPFFHQRAPILVDNGHKNIQMNKIGDYNLFDWIKVMENAKSIHTVATSINYILDVLDMPSDIQIYRRVHENGGFRDHTDYDYIYNKSYTYK